MIFENPLMVYGFFALLIPILIHLFNLQRYKKVVFSSIVFLKLAEKDAKQKVKVKKWLLLLIRCLALVFLVLTFMDPVIPNENGASQSHYDVLIDQTLSMHEVNPTGNSLFKFAKEKAELIFQEDQLTMVDDLALLSDVKASKIVLISDFQKNNIEPLVYSGTLELMRLSNKKNNVFVDSLWFSKPMISTGSNELKLKLINKGDAQSLTVSVLLKGRQIRSLSVELSKNETKELTTEIELLAGLNELEVVLEDKGFGFDNRFQFTCTTQSKITTSVFSDDKSVISSVLKNEELFEINQMKYTQYDPQKMMESDVVYLEGFNRVTRSLLTQLKTYVKGGGHLFVALDSIGGDQWNEIFSELKTERSIIPAYVEASVNLDGGIFKDVLLENKKKFDAPKFKSNFNIAESGENYISARPLGNICSKYAFGSGAITILGVPFRTEHTNFHKHALFVPFIYNLAFESVEQGQLYARLGEELYKAGRSDSLAQLIVKGEEQIAVRYREIQGVYYYELSDEMTEVGIYDLVNGSIKTDALAMNASKTESIPDYYSDDELKGLFPKADLKIYDIEGSSDWGNYANNFAEATPLWKYCLILSLLFLLGEIVLIRAFK